MSECRDVLAVVPVHPNPAATQAARAACSKHPDFFRCVDPLGYGESQWMLKHALAAVRACVCSCVCVRAGQVTH